MAHDDEELDWGDADNDWETEAAVAPMEVDRQPQHSLTTAPGNEDQVQVSTGKESQPSTQESNATSQVPQKDASFASPPTRNGGGGGRRTVSRSSSDFGKSLPPGLPRRPSMSAPHVGRSDPLAASAMAPSPTKSTNHLPPDWIEQKSTSTGAIYYLNTKTKDTTWTKPSFPAATGNAESAQLDSPPLSRRDREKRRPTSPNVPTLPPAHGSLPARPQFNSSQQKRERSASPPGRARSIERKLEPEREPRRGERRPPGTQARFSPPPRTRDVQMRDVSPEPRRYRSPSPQAAQDRGKAGGNRPYNGRERSPPPATRGQRPPSPRRDDRGIRRNPPPRNRSRSPGPSRRRSPSPPGVRGGRTPPRAARASPPPTSLPQKRRGDTPPPSARSNGYPDRLDDKENRNSREDLQSKRRRVEDDRGNYNSQANPRDDRPDSRIFDRRPADEPPAGRRAPLPPQDERFRTSVVKVKPPRPPRRRSQSPPPPQSATSESRFAPNLTHGSDWKASPVLTPTEKIKLPETTDAVAAAYGNRRRGGVPQDDTPQNDVNAPKLPPSGPGSRTQRSYGPPIRDGPRSKSPEAFGSREPPRGPRGTHRSPNVVARPLSPRRESPPRQRSPPRRQVSPPRRPRSPPGQDKRLGDRDNRGPDRTSYPRGGQPPAGPAMRGDRGRGRPMRTWGQPQSDRPVPDSNFSGRDNRYRDNPGDSRGLQDGRADQRGPQLERSRLQGRIQDKRDDDYVDHADRYESSGQHREPMEVDDQQEWANSAKYGRDDDQSEQSGRSLDEDSKQRPDPLPEARRLSIRETDDDRSRGYMPRKEVAATSPQTVPGGLRLPIENARSPIPENRQDHSARSSQDSAPPKLVAADEDRAREDEGRKESNVGRPKIVRRDLAPIATNGLSTLEPGSAQPTSVSMDGAKDHTDGQGESSAATPVSRGSLLTRISALEPSTSGDRSKGKRELPSTSPGAGSSTSLQARMDSGDRPPMVKRDTDDSDRRRRKSRRTRGPSGGGRNREPQA